MSNLVFDLLLLPFDNLLRSQKATKSLDGDCIGLLIPPFDILQMVSKVLKESRY